MIEINGNKYRNIQEQVKKNMDDIAEIKESGGTSYEAGTGINIEDGVISVDNTIATKEDINTYTAGYGLTFGESNEFEIDSSVVATKSDIPTYTQDQGITITDNNEIKANIGYGLEFRATESDSDEIIIDTDVVATKEDLPHLYQHNIVGMSSDTQDFVVFSFINTTSTPMNFGQVREWLYDNGFTGEINNEKHYLPATGRCSADSFEFDYTPQGQSTDSDYCESVVVGVRATNSDDNEIKALVSRLKEKDSQSDAYEEDYMGVSDSFTDTVITLC